MKGQQRVIIENPSPRVEVGDFPVKRVIGDRIVAGADIFSDGHDAVRAELLYRKAEEVEWRSAEMEHEVNDRWKASFRVTETGTYLFTISAWVDHFKSWHRDILKKLDAGSQEHVDLLVGAELIRRTVEAYPSMNAENSTYLTELARVMSDKRRNPEKRSAAIENGALYQVMLGYPLKDHVVRYPQELEISVDREKANFSSWYELFPRSLGKNGTHGTFADCIRFLPYLEEMGFDVLYLPPIHPIGETKRKGKNNSTTSEPGEPGSPWAIGGKEGGHKAIHSELGTPEEFRRLVRAASGKGIDVALDIAFQCSPDHPYVTEHPRWFRQRPDGSLQYAENPPKKYEDIYPINFETEDWENLWEELKSIFLHWIHQGVRIFRVDNPHTKSFRFWGWVIGEIKQEYPEVIFLSEAFTRPKVMYQLAKLGFTQSYTYFTWRNTKHELTSYLEELTQTDAREFFRPNFWPNTPDILPEFLQMTNRAGFIQRLILAATMSSNYGIYGPAFELMENTPVRPGKEEYLDSEKYELRQWDTGNRESLRKIIGHLNRIRKENSALQNTHSLLFHHIDNDALICYSKVSRDGTNVILVVVNLDPHHTQSGWVGLQLHKLGLDHQEPYQVHDLLSGSFYIWSGEFNYVEINPGIMPAHIFRIRRRVRSERDFDYFV